MATALTLFVVSGAPWTTHLFQNAPMLASDIWRAKLGLILNEGTNADALIAVHAAGQIPYFSRRKTVDLLGRNDEKIAKGQPVVAFRPGHNKWNYNYSILELKPDIVADEWGEVKDFLSGSPMYTRLPNGLWIRKDSHKVDRSIVSQAFRED